MPYPQAATLITGAQTHGSRNCWGSGYMEHIHQRKTLRPVTMEISVSQTPSADICPQNRLCIWVGVWETVDNLIEAFGSWRLQGLPQSVRKENQDNSFIVWKRCPHSPFQVVKCTYRNTHTHRWLRKGYTDLHIIQKVTDTRLKCLGSKIKKEC